MSNNTKEFKIIGVNVANKESVCFVMETSGGYEKVFANFLIINGIEVAIINAKRVRQFANAMGMFAKTDRIDAQMIRYYAQTLYAKNSLRTCVQKSETEQCFTELLRRR